MQSPETGFYMESGTQDLVLAVVDSSPFHAGKRAELFLIYFKTGNTAIFTKVYESSTKTACSFKLHTV
jgi:hypothetical protein